MVTSCFITTILMLQFLTNYGVDVMVTLGPRQSTTLKYLGVIPYRSPKITMTGDGHSIYFLLM